MRPYNFFVNGEAKTRHHGTFDAVVVVVVVVVFVVGVTTLSLGNCCSL